MVIVENATNGLRPMRDVMRLMQCGDLSQSIHIWLESLLDVGMRQAPGPSNPTLPTSRASLLKGQELSFSTAVPTLRLSGCEALRMIDSSVVAGSG